MPSFGVQFHDILDIGRFLELPRQYPDWGATPSFGMCGEQTRLASHALLLPLT